MSIVPEGTLNPPGFATALASEDNYAYPVQEADFTDLSKQENDTTPNLIVSFFTDIETSLKSFFDSCLENNEYVSRHPTPIRNILADIVVVFEQGKMTPQQYNAVTSKRLTPFRL